MEIDAWVKKKKKFNATVLSFLESESDSGYEFYELTKIVDDQKFVKNEQSAREIYQLLYKIGDNHQRTADFFNRLGRIFELLKQERLLISDIELFHIYKGNKRLLLLLFEYKIIILNEYIKKHIMKNRDLNGRKLYFYFFSGIKDYLGKRKRKHIEYKIKQKFDENINIFESKIKEGENDSLICRIIRHDLIQEFVSYVNRMNLSFTSTIKADFYESNSFLIENEPSLIEYAFFYGSIQVIKFILNNHIEFPSNVFQYAIHSNNPEMIEILEENKIQVYKENVIESIKCHHNDIAVYIIDNLIDKSQEEEEFDDDINHAIIEFSNYYYYPEDINSMISNPEKEKIKMFNLASSLTNISIPSSITSIGSYAFSKCSKIIQVSIPSSVIYIRDNAFRECSRLARISIPSSVTSIGNYAFYGCSSLSQISIPSSVTSIGGSVFSECSSLEQISIPSSVNSIGGNVFSECSSLTQISIPSSVTSIGGGAFLECLSLKHISIPSSVTEIGDDAFKYCVLLAQISIPSTVIKIGNDAFFGCSSLEQISIPSNISIKNLGLDSKIKINYSCV